MLDFILIDGKRLVIDDQSHLLYYDTNSSPFNPYTVNANTILYSTSNDTGETISLGEFQMRPQAAIDAFLAVFEDYWHTLKQQGHSIDTIWWA